VKVITGGQTVTGDVKIDGATSFCPQNSPFYQCAAEVSVDDEPVTIRVDMWAEGGTINVARNSGGGPSEVTVEVLKGGTSLGAKTFHPDYETSEPNGQGCGEVTNAHEHLTLDPP
jgi:hypothetical protein